VGAQLAQLFSSLPVDVVLNVTGGHRRTPEIGSQQCERPAAGEGLTAEAEVGTGQEG